VYEQSVTPLTFFARVIQHGAASVDFALNIGTLALLGLLAAEELGKGGVGVVP
jgi:hypothetical protein